MTTPEDTAATVVVPLTASDASAVTLTVVTQPGHGMLTGIGPTWTYKPAANYAGPDSAVVRATDGHGTGMATVTITVTPVNDAPSITSTSSEPLSYMERGDALPIDPEVAINDIDSTTLASALVKIATGCSAEDVLALASPPAAITVTAYDAASCTLALSGAASLADYQDALRRVSFANASHTPSTAARSVQFTIDDGGATNKSASLTRALTVTAIDDAPVAVGDAATVSEDTAATPITVLENDTDVDGGPLTVAAVSQPANGTVAIIGGGTGVTYAPRADYCNTDGSLDTFTYTLAPGDSTATVSVAVTCVDDPPVAVADTATITEDAAATLIAVLANDSDVDGGPISVAAVTQPANGTVAITGTGVTYAPRADYCNTGGGPDSFTYTLAPGGSTAAVTVAVLCVDDPPIAIADVATVTEDAAATPITVLANDTDVDGGPISIGAITQPVNGTTALTAAGVTYTPRANYCNSGGSPDIFTYTLAPGNSTATVSVTVTCVDDPPVAVDDLATVAEDAPATAIAVLANDTDVDGGPRTIASVTQPANGTVVIAGTGVTYAPRADYCSTAETGPDTFTYTLAPGDSTATVSVTVTCVDDPPVAVADSATVTESSLSNTISVLGNDTDIDGGPKTITAVSQPGHGIAAIGPEGQSVLYTPADRYCTDAPNVSADTFQYTLAGGSQATVSVRVTCVCGLNQPTDFVVGSN